MLVLVLGLDSTIVMCVLGRCSRMHLSRCTAAVVIGAAKRHGRGGSTLRGNRQHQQPYQQRSDQQMHSGNVPQRVRAALRATCPSPRRG